MYLIVPTVITTPPQKPLDESLTAQSFEDILMSAAAALYKHL